MTRRKHCRVLADGVAVTATVEFPRHGQMLVLLPVPARRVEFPDVDEVHDVCCTGTCTTSQARVAAAGRDEGEVQDE